MAASDLSPAQLDVRPREGARATAPASASSGAEWSAPALRPIAHWVLMPGERGRSRLTMVWEIPDPLPPC